MNSYKTEYRERGGNHQVCSVRANEIKADAREKSTKEECKNED